jgi:serine/threonine protein kinase
MILRHFVRHNKLDLSSLQPAYSPKFADLVLSLAPNGDLRELVKKNGSLSLSCARYYTAQVVDTVQWMHGKGILHRDLKPENILLDHDMRIKLADFGSAYISKDLDLCEWVGVTCGCGFICLDSTAAKHFCRDCSVCLPRAAFGFKNY